MIRATMINVERLPRGESPSILEREREREQETEELLKFLEQLAIWRVQTIQRIGCLAMCLAIV